MRMSFFVRRRQRGWNLRGYQSVSDCPSLASRRTPLLLLQFLLLCRRRRRRHRAWSVWKTSSRTRSSRVISCSTSTCLLRPHCWTSTRCPIRASRKSSYPESSELRSRSRLGLTLGRVDVEVARRVRERVSPSRPSIDRFPSLPIDFGPWQIG